MRPSDAKSVDIADVYKSDQLAGYLTRTREGTSFQYARDYIGGTGEAVASTLPVREASYVTGAGAVPAFFAGLLPEGVRLLAVVAAVKTSPDDELSLLIAVGEDAVGDVRIIPHGSEPATKPRALPAVPGEVSFADLFARSIDPSTAELDRALPGVQEKLSDAMVSFPLAGAKGPAILKLNPAAFPRIVENEAFCLSLAKRAGLTVPRFEVIEDRDGVSGLLVERFDRRVANGSVRRLAQEDACQLLNRWPADKYRVSINDMAERLVEVTSSREASIMDLVEQVAFSWIVGNGDMHAKNYSVQWLKEERLVVPSPVYDVVSTIPYPLDQHMALKLDGRDANLRGRFLVDFASRFGVPESMSRRRLSALADGVAPYIDEASHIGFDDRTTERLATEMNRRITALRRFD
ncbi:MAG: type II toxin-antitoxin system HipA family toxin [Gammaproteobacteria bacterium]|nr:MAG: type II toxin-antitoxin system HipA family toxin [Gammaproteobacteria bacterium]